MFFVVFDLKNGKLPQYLFSGIAGNIKHITYPETNPTFVPGTLPKNVQAYWCDKQSIADTIQDNIVAFSKKYGDIPVEIVRDLNQSQIWNGDTPVLPKKAIIEFSYVDPALPGEPNPTPSVTEQGLLAATVGNENIVIIVDQYAQIGEFLPRLAEQISNVEGYTANVNKEQVVIESTLENPRFVWIDLANAKKAVKTQILELAGVELSNQPENIDFTKDVEFKEQ